MAGTKANKTSFKKGESPPKQKGMKNKTTIVKESLGLNRWQDMVNYVNGEGVEKYIQEMNKLTGRNYIIAYTSITEYIRPKLNRHTLEGELKKEITLNIVRGKPNTEQPSSGTGENS